MKANEPLAIKLEAVVHKGPSIWIKRYRRFGKGKVGKCPFVVFL
jgi:hypothetical protein